MIGRVLKSILAAIHGNRAISEAAKGNAELVLLHLDKAEAHSGKLLAEHALLRASALRALERDVEFRNAAIVSANLIDAEKGLSEDDRSYMKAFLWILSKQIVEHLSAEEKDRLFANVHSVELSRVSRHLLSDFGLLEHPDWERHSPASRRVQ